MKRINLTPEMAKERRRFGLASTTMHDRYSVVEPGGDPPNDRPVLRVRGIKNDYLIDIKRLLKKSRTSFWVRMDMAESDADYIIRHGMTDPLADNIIGGHVRINNIAVGKRGNAFRHIIKTLNDDYGCHVASIWLYTWPDCN